MRAKVRKLIDRRSAGNTSETHEYRLSWWDRVSAIFFMLMGFLLLFLWSAGNSDADQNGKGLFLAGALMALAGLLMTYRAFNIKVYLSPDAIEMQGPFSTKSLPMQAIKGRREYKPERTRYSPKRYLLVVANSDDLPTFRLRDDMNFDEAFFAWFHSLPDLDALDKKNAKDSNFGLI